MTTLIICITVIIVTLLICATIVYITQFVRWMAQHQLPMYTHAELQWVPNTPAPVEEKPVGFQVPENTTEPKLTDVEKMNQILSDAASTVSALMRGEVDFDDIKN